MGLVQGRSATVGFLVQGENGFSGPVTLNFSGLPAGVSASPSNPSLTVGHEKGVQFIAAPGAAVGAAKATVSAAGGTVRQQVQLPVSVVAAVTFDPRLKFIRTDAVTEHFLWPNSHWTLYNSPTNRFFATDPEGNAVEVFNAATETESATITVPAAYAIDQTADQSTLWVGTLIGDVYVLDPTTLKVLHRYVARQIGPYGFAAVAALPMAGGQVALLGAYQSAVPNVDGTDTFAIWTPASNAITVYREAGFFVPGVPAQPLCPGFLNIGSFALTADRSHVLIGSADTDNHVCLYSPTAGLEADIQAGGVLSASTLLVSPDGRYLALPENPGIALYDPNTLDLLRTFPTVAGFVSMTAWFSSDGATLYEAWSTPAQVYAYDVATGKQIGWLSNIMVPAITGGFLTGPTDTPIFQATDPAGVAAGPAEEGYAFLDTSQLNTGPPGTAFVKAYLTPAFGPIEGGTPVQWPSTAGGAVFFAANQAAAEFDGQQIAAVAPPGTAGPTDVYVFAAGGATNLDPDGFSYGPSIVEVTPNLATADGGGTGVVYGYGFGLNPAVVNAPVPSDLQVSVGGVAAKILSWNRQAYNLLIPPFPLQSITFQIPAGAQGPAAVTVTNDNGSATAQAGITYLPAATQYPLPGAKLAQGVFDPANGLYYFTDATALQVFSPGQQKWLAPIPVAPAGGSAAERLWGLSLSPDDSMLAIADYAGDAIDLLNPAQPDAVRSFAFQPPLVPPNLSVHPVGVAVSDSGSVYITAQSIGGTGYSGFFKLDTTTGALTNYQTDAPGGPDNYLRVALSADGARAYFNADGQVFYVNTADDQVVQASADQGCCYGNYDLALAPSGNQVEASSYLYDGSLDASAFLTLNDYEQLGATFISGSVFSPHGGLLYQPEANGVAIFDGRLGTLLDQLALPFALSADYDALVGDGSDKNIVALTPNGIAVLDLGSIISSPLPPFLAAALSAPPSAGGMSRIVPPAIAATRLGGRSRWRRLSAPRPSRSGLFRPSRNPED